MIPAIIGAAATLGAGGIAAGSGKRSQRRAYQYNKQLMDYQNEINLQNWHLQNQYNSPSAQMSRYQSAGINPNVVAGDIGGSVGVAGDVGGVSPSGVNPSDFAFGRPIADALASMPDIINSYFVNKERVSNTHANIAKTGVYNNQADSLKFENHITEATLMETITNRLNNLRYDILRNNANALSIESQRIDNEIGLNARGYQLASVDPTAGNIPTAYGTMSNDKSAYEYRESRLKEFKNNVKADLSTSLYEIALHGLDSENIKSQRAYLKMLQSKYDVEKINADFDKAIANLSFSDIMEHPGKLLMLIFKALGSAQAIAQPYIMQYQRRQSQPTMIESYDGEGVLTGVKVTR